MKNHTFRATGTMIVLALTAIQSLAQSIYEPYTFITLAGNTGYGVALDSAGILYVADANNKTIQKLMPDGVVTILAGLPGVSGSADGAGSDARFGSSYNGPTGVAVDTAGNVYVADSGNSTIRKMTPVGTNWVVTTLAGLPQVDANDWPVGGSADGMGSAARFHYPYGVAVDSAGSVYVADTFNATIRKVSPEGVVTTLAGLAGRLGSADGTGSAARFYNPCAVAVDTAGNVYVAEWGNNTIRKMTLVGTNWMVTTLAGLPQVDAAGFHVGGSADGTGSAARFGYPSGVAVDSAGTLYVADTSNGMIRKVTPAGVVTTLAGVAQFDPNGNPLGGIADGTGSAARFNQPSGVAVDSAGNLSVADSSTIRKGFPAVGRPVIFTQPKGRTVTATYGVTFSALANGTVPLAYQWFKDGVELPGATNTSLSIATVQAADAGVYTFTVSNVLGRVSSSNAVLAVAAPYTFTTLAGNAGYGSADGTGSAARFNAPSGVAVDSEGNVYVADTYNETIRKVTPQGVVKTLAGSPGIFGNSDGIGSAAQFSDFRGVAVDSSGNVYLADTWNHTIRKATPEGRVTTLAGLAGSPGSADGSGSIARFRGPFGLAVDSTGNIYVADSGNHTIRKVTPAGVVVTVAGLARLDGSGNSVGGNADGTGNAARFNFPEDVAVDSAGNVYVADLVNNTIRKVTPAGVVTTLAGLAGAYGSADGTGSAARFYNPCAVAVDTAGIVYVADSGNNTIRKVSQAGMVTTLAGLAGHSGSADGTGTVAQFGSLYHHPGTGPKSVAVDGMGNIFVADTVNNTIRKVTSAGVVTTVAGLAAQFDNAGNQVAGGAGLTDGTGSAARFFSPRGLAVDSAGNVYVADRGNQTIRKVTPAGVVTTLAGNASIKNESENPAGGYSDGTGSAARFNYPSGVAVDTRGNLYVSDTDNSAIRKVTPEGMVTTLAGLAGNFGSADGMGSDARFNQPTGVAVDSAGNLYVADTGNSTIRKVTPLGAVTTLAGRAGNSGSADGTGSDAQFKFSDEFSDDYYVFAAVAVDGAGNIYVVDSGNHTIRKMTPEGIVTTLAGLAGSFGSADGAGSSARFDLPQGIALDGLGNVYVADTGNRTIRKGFPAPMILNSGFNEGQFGFNLTGPSGRLVVVEASTDLVNWLPIWTNTFAGPLNFIDAQSGVTSNRFYRAHVP